MLATMNHASHALDFRIAADHPSLPGHFPGRPVVPGVVLLDRVLQAIEQSQPSLGALRLPQVKFVNPLLPGQVARIEWRETADARWRFRILRGDEPIASGEVVAA